MNSIVIKIVIALIAVAGIGGWILYQRVQLQEAQLKISQVEKNLQEARQQRDAVIELNKQNSLEITKISNEKKSIENALLSIEAQRKKDSLALNEISALIKSSSANPENQTKLSPVVAVTVDKIQSVRTTRSGK